MLTIFHNFGLYCRASQMKTLWGDITAVNHCSYSLKYRNGMTHIRGKPSFALSPYSIDGSRLEIYLSRGVFWRPLTCMKWCRVVPLIYWRHRTEQVVVPAAMFPVSWRTSRVFVVSESVVSVCVVSVVRLGRFCFSTAPCHTAAGPARQARDIRKSADPEVLSK